MADLRASLDEFKPDLARQYKVTVHNLFERMAKRYGPTLRGVSNDWDFAKVWRETVQPCCTVRYGADRVGGELALDDEYLTKRAETYAEAAIESWLGKIEAKLGELDDASVKRLDGVAFLITGERGGKSVRIEQTMILNFSKLGKPFNQFPARIYVDGRAVSEAKFKRS